MCQRSEAYTAQLRHDLGNSALQANAITNIQNNMQQANQGQSQFDFDQYQFDPIENIPTFVPCKNCIDAGNQQFCSVITPCQMCEAQQIGDTCREELNVPRQRYPAMAFPPIVGNMRDPMPASPSDAPAYSDAEDLQDIYNASPRVPPRRQPAQFGGMDYYPPEEDMRPFTSAGPPDPNLFQTPADTPGPATPLTGNDMYDPQLLLDQSHLTANDFDFGNNEAILNDPAFAAVNPFASNVPQPQPRFPLANDPWDAAAFVKDMYLEGPYKKRINCLREINPDDPPPAEVKGCSERPFPNATAAAPDDFVSALLNNINSAA